MTGGSGQEKRERTREEKVRIDLLLLRMLVDLHLDIRIRDNRDQLGQYLSLSSSLVVIPFQFSQSGPSPSSHIPSIPRQHILPTPPSSGVAPPTNVAGSHAFAMAPRVNPQVSPPQRTHSPLMVSHISSLLT